MSVNYNPVTPTEGLVLCIDPSNPRCYPGSGTTVFDLSGQGNNGTLTNGASVVNTGGGRALDFDGTNDYVLVPNNNSLNFGTAAFSLCAWVQASNPVTNQDAIFGKDSFAGTSSYAGYLLNVSGTPAKWAFETRNVVSGSGPDTQLLSVSAPGTTWTHLAGVREGTSPATLRLYVNGLSDNSATETAITNVTNSTAAIIGALNAGLLSQFFNGQLDDIRIYNRALSPSEIRILASRPGIGLRQERDRQTFYQTNTRAQNHSLISNMF